MDTLRKLFEEEVVASILSSNLSQLSGKAFKYKKDGEDGIIKAPKGIRGWKGKQLNMVYKALENTDGVKIQGFNFTGALTIHFTHNSKHYSVQGYGPDGVWVRQESKTGSKVINVKTEQEYYDKTLQ